MEKQYRFQCNMHGAWIEEAQHGISWQEACRLVSEWNLGRAQMFKMAASDILKMSPEDYFRHVTF